MTPWARDQPVARPLPKHRTTQTQNKSINTKRAMLRVEFEPTIPASERAKTVHALDRVATVTNVRDDLNRRFESDKVRRKKKYGVTSESMEKIDQTELNKFKYSFKLQSYRTKLELHVESLIDIQWMRSQDVEGNGTDEVAWILLPQRGRETGSVAPSLSSFVFWRFTSNGFDMQTGYPSFL
jgi:hypothetical protein